MVYGNPKIIGNSDNIIVQFNSILLEEVIIISSWIYSLNQHFHGKVIQIHYVANYLNVLVFSKELSTT